MRSKASSRACRRCSATIPPSCSPRMAFPGGTISGFRPTIRRCRTSAFSIRAAGCAPLFREQRIVGGVIFSSNEVVAPGIVANLSPDRNMLQIGECDDRTERADRTAARPARRGLDRIARGLAHQGDDLVQAPDQHVDVGAVPVHRANRAGGAGRPGVARRGAASARRGQHHRAKLLSPTSSASPAPAPRPTTSRRSCRTTNSAVPWKSTCWCKAPAAFARAAGLSTPMLDLLAALAIRQARDKGLYQG